MDGSSHVCCASPDLAFLGLFPPSGPVSGQQGLGGSLSLLLRKVGKGWTSAALQQAEHGHQSPAQTQPLLAVQGAAVQGMGPLNCARSHGARQGRAGTPLSGTPDSPSSQNLGTTSCLVQNAWSWILQCLYSRSSPISICPGGAPSYSVFLVEGAHFLPSSLPLPMTNPNRKALSTHGSFQKHHCLRRESEGKLSARPSGFDLRP